MDYDLYLFSCLIKFYDAEFDEESYDFQYDILPTLYEDFENSKYNVDTKGAYECITEYLKDKYSPKTIIRDELTLELKEFLFESDVIMFARKLFVDIEVFTTKLNLPTSYSDSIWYIEQYAIGYSVIQEHK
jgi:hypothetical protein